jgi:hypothetical protein
VGQQGALPVRDAHCHFHGGIPASWLDLKIRSAGDPARISDRLSVARADIQRILRYGRNSPPPDPSAAATAFFDLYSAIETHCHWMEQAGSGSRDLYAQAPVALATEAAAHEVARTDLFFSLIGDRQRMRNRVRGLLDAADALSPNTLHFRLTVPRARRFQPAWATAEVLDLLAPLIERRVFDGFDLSGLDSEMPASQTLRLTDQLLQLRAAAGSGGRRLSVSVHFGESVSRDGFDDMLRLATSLRGAGVNSLGHGILLWHPALFGAADDATATVLGEILAAGVRLEVCPAVARLYGCPLDAQALPVGVADIRAHVSFGTDAPGLVGYDQLPDLPVTG